MLQLPRSAIPRCLLLAAAVLFVQCGDNRFGGATGLGDQVLIAADPSILDFGKPVEIQLPVSSMTSLLDTSNNATPALHKTQALFSNERTVDLTLGMWEGEAAYGYASFSVTCTLGVPVDSPYYRPESTKIAVELAFVPAAENRHRGVHSLSYVVGTHPRRKGYLDRVDRVLLDVLDTLRFNKTADSAAAIYSSDAATLDSGVHYRIRTDTSATTKYGPMLSIRMLRQGGRVSAADTIVQSGYRSETVTSVWAHDTVYDSRRNDTTDAISSVDTLYYHCAIDSLIIRRRAVGETLLVDTTYNSYTKYLKQGAISNFTGLRPIVTIGPLYLLVAPTDSGLLRVKRPTVRVKYRGKQNSASPWVADSTGELTCSDADYTVFETDPSGRDSKPISSWQSGRYACIKLTGLDRLWQAMESGSGGGMYREVLKASVDIEVTNVSAERAAPNDTLSDTLLFFYGLGAEPAIPKTSQLHAKKGVLLKHGARTVVSLPMHMDLKRLLDNGKPAAAYAYFTAPSWLRYERWQVMEFAPANGVFTLTGVVARPE